MNYLINKMLLDLEAGLKGKDIQYFYFGVPYSLSEKALDEGVLMIRPVSTDIDSAATGLRDKETKRVRIIVAKSMKADVYKNAQKETGDKFMTRIFENKDESNQLQSNTIRYIVRTNFKRWGILQEEMNIQYNTNEIDGVPMGVAIAGADLTVIDHYVQPIS